MTNKISVTGALGRDAELKHTKSGAPVLEFSVADSLSRKDDNGGWVDVRETIWWRVSLWGALAETLAPVLVKGARVEVTGPIQIRTYSKVDGTQGISYEIRADTVGVVARHGATSPATQQFGSSAAQSAFDQYNAAAADPNSWGGGDDAPPF